MRIERIRIDKNWAWGGPQSRGGAMLYPGEYRVPQDVTTALAERALAEGAAVRISPEGDVRPAIKADVTVEGMPKSAQKKGKRVKRKGKSLGAAPENKGALA